MSIAKYLGIALWATFGENTTRVGVEDSWATLGNAVVDFLEWSDQ